MESRPDVGPIVFLGSDAVAARCLRVLAGRLPVALAVTPPDRRRGRGGRATPTPVAEAAAELAIPVLATRDVNADPACAAIEAASPSLLVVVAFGQILRGRVLGAAPLGALNLHFSLLPRWRGAAPVQRAILAGDPETGVAVQRVVAALDAGPVLAERRTPIGPRDDTPTLFDRLTDIGAPLLAETAQAVLAGTVGPGIEQDESVVTYAAKIGRDEGGLDPVAQDAATMGRVIRAFGARPGCTALLRRAEGSTCPVRIHEAAVLEGEGGRPGTVVAVDRDGIVVSARGGRLRITRLQRVGGRVLDAAAFRNGFPVAPGDRMTSAGQVLPGRDPGSRPSSAS